MSLFSFVQKIHNKRKIQRFQQKLVRNRRDFAQSSTQYHTKSNNQKDKSRVYAWFFKDGWAILGIFFFISVTIWYFGFYQQTFHMTNISIQGTKFIQQTTVQQFIDEYTNSNMYALVKRNTFWTVNAKKLECLLGESLQQSFALESVHVEKHFPNTLFIKIVERIPSITWITSKSSTEHVYLVDRQGIVTKTLEKKEDADPAFPIIFDKNRDQLKEGGEQIISSEYIQFLLTIHENFSKKSGLQIQQYELPLIECQEKQYVAEKIFEQALSSSISDEYRTKQKQIQEQFQRGDLSIDESLQALDAMKQEEIQKLGETNVEGSNLHKMQWETVYVPIECNLSKVATELHVITTKDSHSFAVYLDSLVDANIQLENLQTVLHEKIQNKDAIQYIDVRIPDRIYYQ
ncbi:MAG TPA: FtsQ-type POTRA domain-containing protein [Patescibacteria group bacterium]|nr:FtsQ-type POTRA domain-containing protein [Patescibacteria group bacterium]